uniref:Uncharacterized protein n=1 Tax=Caenorhabditis japonica TaxID=281687 RepID=A0A8R1IT22_CAEJA
MKISTKLTNVHKVWETEMSGDTFYKLSNVSGMSDMAPLAIISESITHNDFNFSRPEDKESYEKMVAILFNDICHNFEMGAPEEQ